MSSRRFIKQLGGNEVIDEVFLASGKQLRPNRAGNLYLQVRLSDRSGAVMGMMWNANDRVYSQFADGDYVRVEGKSQVYNGSMQIIIQDIEQATGDVNEQEFIAVTEKDTEQLAIRVAELLNSVSDRHLQALASCILEDNGFMTQFQLAPAGIKLHHAYRGGLLEHVCSLMEVCDQVAGLYPFIDRDLLLFGAFLHDLGKIEELTYDRDLAYSDHGQLVGHIVQGVTILREFISRTEGQLGEPFAAELQMRLEHMVVSHHGTLEFGSPRVPMTPEAITLHFLDNLDAKLHSVNQLLESDANPQSPWTPYEASLGRKLFRGSGETPGSA